MAFASLFESREKSPKVRRRSSPSAPSHFIAGQSSGHASTTSRPKLNPSGVSQRNAPWVFP
jgi:hypothetical protein